MDIAFLGLGIMGSRMATNLAKAGHKVKVWNRTPEKAAELVAAGCAPSPSPVRVVKGAQVVITMLSDPQALRDVALGQGMVDAMEHGALWIDCSTVDPSTSRQMAANATNRGLRFLDAPVSGSSGAAANAKLVFFAGGSEADIESARPAFDAMGTRIVHAGPQGSGASLKLVNNLFLAQVQAAWSEALGLAELFGLPQEKVNEAILPTHVAPAFLGFKSGKIGARDWTPEFPLKHALKDIRLALAAAKEGGMELHQLAAAETLYAQALSRGFGDADISAIHEIASRG
jgi:3-hydroxyisobutyrate dehydrogenase-like beta-hydroxyacid dehydrogenase